LDSYISQDTYLNSRRGQYAARNGGVAPWYHSLNARLLQDFFIETGSGKRNTLQLSVEVVNVLNMLNSSWGLAKQPARASLLQFAGYESTNGRPVYSFSPLTDSFITTNNILSRWQLQVGLRYTFN
jgi:outer membrane receptor for Fe3+-dicitrate